MKITRSTKCTLKFCNKAKRDKLTLVIAEYGNVMNFFIDRFWEDCPHKMAIGKKNIDAPETWLSYTMRNEAAREAIGMIKGSRKRDGDEAKKPTHRGKQIQVSGHIAKPKPAKRTTEFDAWLHLCCIGNHIIFDLPIKYHRHFNELAAKGRRFNSYIITCDYVQFAFEIETGPKKTEGRAVGIDTGINTLAATSDGQQYGTDTKAHVDRINRCKHGSKGQQRAQRALRQRMDEVAKEVVADDVKLVVFENLKRLGYKSKLKRRLSKNVRRSIGAWPYRYWLERLKMTCEDRRSAYRSVVPYKTSQICHVCGHVDRRSRLGETFRCRECGYTGNADINAARNILDRFLTGVYGPGCKQESCLLAGVA